MKIGFIGAGNMARAMIKGLISSGIDPENIWASAGSDATRKRVADEFNIDTSRSNRAIARSCDVLFLAVKSYMYQDLIDEIREQLKPESLVVAMTTGWDIQGLERAFGQPVKLIRIMPNTPAMVLAAVTAMCVNAEVTALEEERVQQLLESFGQVYRVPESLMEAVTGVAGSGPAYIFMLIEAMAQAGIQAGLPSNQSYPMAAQTVLGSAKTVLESGLHPAQLRDQVCSPGGTTIDAVAVLESSGFKAAIMQAIAACVTKAKQ